MPPNILNSPLATGHRPSEPRCGAEIPIPSGHQPLLFYFAPTGIWKTESLTGTFCLISEYFSV
jgi:hypothetical protein